MPKIYARETKLKNVVGRSDYINNQERQEEIVFQKSFMENDWNDYVKYEKEHQKTNHENIQARETVIALPNELSEHIEVLEKVCDDLGHNLYGFNRDFEYAVHWNESHTNLHAHFIYSERERNQERIAKVYKRDMWYDIETNKMAKANAENAELRFKKGEVQKNSDGTIKYDCDPFTVKDKKYNHKNWLSERNEIIQKTFLEHGYKLEIQNEESPYLSQVKLYKGARHDYLENAKQYNQVVQEYNRNTKQLIEFDSNQKENMQEVKQELKKDIKQFNSQSKSLNILSTEHIETMRKTLEKTFNNMKKFVYEYTEPIGMKVKDTLTGLAQIIPKQQERDINIEKMRKVQQIELSDMQNEQKKMQAKETQQAQEYEGPRLSL